MYYLYVYSNVTTIDPELEPDFRPLSAQQFATGSPGGETRHANLSEHRNEVGTQSRPSTTPPRRRETKLSEQFPRPGTWKTHGRDHTTGYFHAKSSRSGSGLETQCQGSCCQPLVTGRHSDIRARKPRVPEVRVPLGHLEAKQMQSSVVNKGGVPHLGTSETNVGQSSHRIPRWHRARSRVSEKKGPCTSPSWPKAVATAWKYPPAEREVPAESGG